MSSLQQDEAGAKDGSAWTPTLIGHAATEHVLMSMWSAGRLPHAIMLCGQAGIGKATLAYRLARFLLATPSRPESNMFGEPDMPADLFISPDHPVFTAVATGAHPGLEVVERTFDEKLKRLRTEIVVGDIRRLQRFFALTAEAGQWRIAIVDTADDLNRQAANALLKMLEEPPQQSLIILISHAPGKLLPTIRSRCQRLNLHPLCAGEVAEVIKAQGLEMRPEKAELAAALAAGSPGQVIALIDNDGLALYEQALELMENLPQLDIKALYQVAETVAKKGAEDRFRLFGHLLQDALHRLARDAAGAPVEAPGFEREATIFARLGPLASLEQWTEVWENTRQLFERTEALNLDRKQAVILTFGAMAKLVR